MRKPILAYIPALARHQAVNAAHPISQILSVRRTSEATRINKDGLIEQVPPQLPRQDWKDSNCPSLLLEPERTNLNTYSEISAGKPLQNITLTDNSITSPDGQLTAIKLTDDATNSRHRFFSNPIDVTSGTQYTISFYVKKSSSNRYVFINAGILGANGSFNLNDQSTTGSVQVFETLDNGWYRIGLTGTAPTTTTSTWILQMQLGTTDGDYIGDGSSFYVWGIQFEQGSYPTSYIKTESSTATRTKDQATGWSGSWINDADLSEGSFFVDVTPYESPTLHRIGLSDGSLSNKVSFFFQINNTQVRFVITSNGVAQIDNYQTLGRNTRSKLLMTFKENECKIYINGTLVHTDTSFVVPSDLDRLNFARDNGSADFFNGKVHDVRVFDYVLSEEEAIKLTS